MAINPVPLAIGSGAVHDDDVLRRMVNGLSGDAQGVALPGDFKVTATSTPSGSVNVAAGGMVIRHHIIRGQSYYGDAPTVTPWSKSLTTAGYHLIVLKIVDPEASPWQPSGTPGAPNTSVAQGPYFMLDTIPASSGTRRASELLTYAAEAIALVSNPSGLGAITNSMINTGPDVRRLFNPRYWTEYDVQRGLGPEDYLGTTQTAFRTWPLNSFAFDIPPWAVTAQVTSRLTVSAMNPSDAEFRNVLAGVTGSVYPWDYNGVDNGQGAETLAASVYSEHDVTTLRGQRVTLTTQGRRVNTSVATGVLGIGPRQQIEYDIRFKETVA